ncbi:MAG: site-specific DNA-methyltransferase, partial [Candidatus Competibacteraceae bacterium]|nr:site-specific DNA-methyltransferase [Candidatus Competibacteraceae bacterium]
MPTLDWIGKAAVVKHHKEVPYRLLEPVPELCHGEDSGNLIVQGDNLHALKALLPRYAGKVKCIYIDPPYNTGSEGWVYNDNVNSPEIRQWLGDVVGKEAEDLSRHDKWLCMMYPRLALLRSFLKDDGVIFISMDDFEIHNLRLLMNEIFGNQNFIAQLVWDKTRKNDARLFSVGHEYLLVYAKSLTTLRRLKTIWREQKPGAAEIVEEWKRLKETHGDDFESIQGALRDWYKDLPKGHPSKKLSRYKWVDANGPWRDRDISWPGGGGPRYDVIHPVTQLPCKVPQAGWRFASEEVMNEQIHRGLVVFRNDHTQPPFRKAHLLPVLDELASEESGIDEVNGDDEQVGLQVMPSVIQKQAQVAVRTLRDIFGGKKVFENPKDHEVLARVIEYVTLEGDIILDSFAGSASTAHAVLEINRRTNKKRKFILVEMDAHIAETVTSERVKKVCIGYKTAKDKQVEGLGGSFQFCRLSEKPLFDLDGQIRADVRFPQLAEFVWFVETGSGFSNQTDTALLGIHEGRAVFLLYNGILKDHSIDG